MFQLSSEVPQLGGPMALSFGFRFLIYVLSLIYIFLILLIGNSSVKLNFDPRKMNKKSLQLERAC